MNYSFHACETDVTKATFDDDIFEREKYADNLTKLVQNTTCPYVIALSSPWGSGKTFFLNAWKNKVAWQNDSKKDEGKIPCTYFSAWEANNETDPLVLLVASIRKELEKCELLSADKQASFLEKTTRIICNPAILGKSALTLIKGIANNYSDSAIEKIGAEVLEKAGENYLDNFNAWQKDKETFSIELNSVITEAREKTNSPILVMIDELDRCKPDYVILLLERIKHLFHVPGLVFVLAIDKEQLLSIIEHTFGMKGEQRHIYLEKFIDIYYELPEPNIMQYARSLILTRIPPDQNFNEDFAEEENLQKIRFPKVYGSSYVNNQNYAELNMFQQVLLGCLERLLPNKSVRSFEKKFYKFITIYTAYNPNFVLSVLLFYIVMSDCTVEDLFSKTNFELINETESQVHFAILSYILANIVSGERSVIEYETCGYSITQSNEKKSQNTDMHLLYKNYISDYTPQRYSENTKNDVRKHHKEGLAKIRNQLQEMLDFGKNFDVV